MQLRNARLCLDCEEVHDAQQCPACASEMYAPITRWVAPGAARPLARRAVVVARGNLPGVDRWREASLENTAAAQRRRGGRSGARGAGLVHAESVAATPFLVVFVRAQGSSTGVRAGLSRIQLLRGLQILHIWWDSQRGCVRDGTGRNPLAREHAHQVDLNQAPLTTCLGSIVFRTGLDWRKGVVYN